MSDAPAAPRPWPVELKVRRAAKTLQVDFDNGESFVLPAEYLRVNTPSAADRGHGGEARTVAGKAGVGIADIRPIGRYAARIAFDDGHDTGLYSWDALYELAQGQEAKWAAYLGELTAKGLSR
jgi:DUF971 family protein